MAEQGCHPGNKLSKQTTETDLLNQYSPFKFNKLLSTSTKKKEDAFQTLKPNWECLDYNISQTVLRMAGGDIKINVKDTEATYVPAPPTPRSTKRRKDETPPLKFINEIWLEKQNALQKKYKKELKVYLKQKKKEKWSKSKTEHNILLSLVGPEWFQELSPNQLRTVEQLHCCILEDTKNNTITNVQENIRKLGLVLTPNHRHIKNALSYCCKSPVEFLLILYQIINPHRKEYSLNDRLLLSAVVHLTMTQTLRELHIRIPSPPVYKKIVVEKPKPAAKRVKYESPYLQPNAFNSPSACDRIYESSRIQYPESPYFVYAPTLAIERLLTDDIFELDLSAFAPEEADLLEDMRRAQLAYDLVWNGERVKLLKPTVLKECEAVSDFYNAYHTKRTLSLPPLHDSEDEECYCKELLEEEETDSCCHHDFGFNCECQGKCDCSRKAKIFTSAKCRICLSRERSKYAQKVIGGITITRNNEVVPIIQATVYQKTCDCLQNYRNRITALKAMNTLKCQKTNYVIGGVVMTRNGPVYILSATLKRIKRKVIVESDLPLSESAKNANFDDLTESTTNSTQKFEAQQECLESPNMKTTYKSSKKGQRTEIEEEKTSEQSKDSTSEEDCDCPKCKCKQRSKMYTASRCKVCEERERQKYIERIISGMKETPSHNLVPIIEGTRLLATCNCLQTYVERILAMEARKKIQRQCTQYVVGGVVITSRGPVYMLSTALLGDSGVCCKNKRKRSHSRKRKCTPREEQSKEEDLKYSGCKCKQELDRFLNHTCTCEQCKVKERREYATYIMGGVASTEDGIVNVVQGVRDQRCDCVEKYKEKIDRLEEYRKRIEARYNLRSQTLKYSIGGVVNTLKGPVYVITGMRPPVDCPCGRALRQKEEEELHEQQMAKIPPTGRIKYHISGVRQSPEGNVFIISHALPIEDCACVKLYDSYIEAHKACLDAYENFLETTHLELGEYMKDATRRYSQSKDSERTNLTTFTNTSSFHRDTSVNLAALRVESNCSVSNYNLLEQDEVVKGIEKICQGQKLKICSRGEVVSLSDESLVSNCVCQETEESSSDESNRCLDFCVKDLQVNNTTSCRSVAKRAKEVLPELKRYVILKKIPTNLGKQMEILKKVLNKMAEDGFPLAKLPYCHELPHFRLWMHLRTGAYWRQRDIDAHEKFSKKGWCHTDICPVRLPPLNLGIPKKDAAKMTWKNAVYIKKLVGQKVEMFYRQLSQKGVDIAREFFPLTCSYEFPNKTFRDVFFAYMPSKEKDTHAFHLEGNYGKPSMKKYSCYC